jgi:hypothetical protein
LGQSKESGEVELPANAGAVGKLAAERKRLRLTSSEEAAASDIDQHVERLLAQAEIADGMSRQTRDERRRQLRESAGALTARPGA